MKAKRTVKAVIFWILTVAVMGAIFLFSCETGDESAALSGNFLELIIEYIGNVVSHNVLRKLAHFTEYAALGFFLCGAIYHTFSKRKFYIPLIPCVLYAVSDEIHQYFVPERSCRIFDVFIDSCGSSVGILIFLLILIIINKHNGKKRMHSTV